MEREQEGALERTFHEWLAFTFCPCLLDCARVKWPKFFKQSGEAIASLRDDDKAELSVKVAVIVRYSMLQGRALREGGGRIAVSSFLTVATLHPSLLTVSPVNACSLAVTSHTALLDQVAAQPRLTGPVPTPRRRSSIPMRGRRRQGSSSEIPRRSRPDPHPPRRPPAPCREGIQYEGRPVGVRHARVPRI